MRRENVTAGVNYLAGKRIALIGANGMLARMVRERAPGGIINGYDLPDFDLTDRRQVFDVLGRARPDIIINCAAYTNVDGCESNVETALAVNGAGPGHLAAAARRIGATLVHVSTDYVFDGQGQRPYREDDTPAPQSAYGRSKRVGEEQIVASGLHDWFIIRTSWLYGPGGRNFVETILRLAAEREELGIVADQVGSPTYTGDLADAIFNLLDAAASHRSPVPGLHGIYHFANSGSCSWYEFAVEIVARYRTCGGSIKTRCIKPLATEDYPMPASRPAYSVLDTAKYLDATGAGIPDWQSALECYLALRQAP